MPHLGYHQPSAWPDLGEVRHEIYRVAASGAMTAAQRHYAGPTRPVEELYDCEADPMNLHNLASSSEHADVLNRMRGALAKHLIDSRDLGFIPEAQMWQRVEAAGTTPMELGRTLDEGYLRKLIDTASHVGTADEAQLLANLKADVDDAVRYWGAVGLAAAERLSPRAVAALHNALQDPDVTVRIEAANALARHGHFEKALPVLAKALEHGNLAAVLHAARAIELLGAKAKAAAPAMRRADERLKGLRPKDIPATVVLPGDVDMAMFIGFSINAFLNRVDPPRPTGEQGAWIDLFNGKSLAGWQTDGGDKVQVKVIGGEIHMLSDGSNFWMPHEKSFRDFELEAEALMPATYNSGIGFRCSHNGRFTGYQCEIAGDMSGSIFAIGKGWVWPKGAEQTAAFKATAGDAFNEGKWNHFRIRCVGEHIEVWVNGVKTADVRDELFAEGAVALQHHGRGGVHRFRNVRVRELKRGE
jgi:hypothetical protein